jgi:hypothetical protein
MNLPTFAANSFFSKLNFNFLFSSFLVFTCLSLKLIKFINFIFYYQTFKKGINLIILIINYINIMKCHQNKSNIRYLDDETKMIKINKQEFKRYAFNF